MRGYAAVALVNPKTPWNIGGVLRAAGCYGGKLVVLAGARPMRLGHLATDTHKSIRMIPTLTVADPFDAIPFGCVPVAVELIEGAKCLTTFPHPERACYIFGPEDGTLEAKVLNRCAAVVQVPTHACMNLAATANVVLYDRLAKGMRETQ